MAAALRRTRVANLPWLRDGSSSSAANVQSVLGCQPECIHVSAHPLTLLTSLMPACSFYIMRLPKRGRQFDRITFHANVTQCLGALQVWRGGGPGGYRNNGERLLWQVQQAPGESVHNLQAALTSAIRPPRTCRLPSTHPACPACPPPRSPPSLQPASPWFLVVARPTLSVGQYPQQQDLTAFRIPHGVFVKMHKGPWHAGGWAGGRVGG